jgi:hypothetical protein
MTLHEPHACTRATSSWLIRRVDAHPRGRDLAFAVDFRARGVAIKARVLAIAIVSWSARLLALGLFLLWGAFFVEHMQEWFMHPAKGFPPPWVWAGQLAHLVLLVGLLMLIRWQLAGAVVTILGAVAFFGGLIVMTGAGSKSLPLVLFLVVTLLPALLSLACWCARHQPSGPAQLPAAGS